MGDKRPWKRSYRTEARSVRVKCWERRLGNPLLSPLVWKVSSGQNPWPLTLPLTVKHLLCRNKCPQSKMLKRLRTLGVIFWDKNLFLDKTFPGLAGQVVPWRAQGSENWETGVLILTVILAGRLHVSGPVHKTRKSGRAEANQRFLRERHELCLEEQEQFRGGGGNACQSQQKT